MLRTAVLLLCFSACLAHARIEGDSDNLGEVNPEDITVPISVCDAQGGWQAVDLGDPSLSEFMVLAADYFIEHEMYNTTFIPCDDYYAQAINACSKAKTTEAGTLDGTAYELNMLLNCPLDENASKMDENTVALEAEVYLPSPSAEDNSPSLTSVAFLE